MIFLVYRIIVGQSFLFVVVFKHVKDEVTQSSGAHYFCGEVSSLFELLCPYV